MNRRTGWLVFLVPACAFLFSLCAPKKQMLWNGKDLEGWAFVLETDSVSAADVWSVKDGAKDEWVKQVNLQYLLAPNAIREQIKKLQVVAILRDWRKNERLRHDDYPNEQVVVVPIPMWPLEKTAAYLEERVAIHQQAQLGNMPDCTPEERWEKPTIFAVHKKGNKGATRLYDTVEAAEKHVASQPGLELKVRPGESPRCAQYCSALPFCPQGQRLVAATAAA